MAECGKIINETAGVHLLRIRQVQEVNDCLHAEVLILLIHYDLVML